MTSQLRLRIRTCNTLANAGSTLKHSRNPHPVTISVGGNPSIHTCFIFVSVHHSDRERGSDVIVAQIAPANIDSHFNNVGKIQILIEFLDRPASYVKRRTFSQLAAKASTTTSNRMLAINITRLASSPAGLGLLRNQFPHLHVLGYPPVEKVAGVYAGGVAE
jgi:hypothetical protein